MVAREIGGKSIPTNADLLRALRTHGIGTRDERMRLVKKPFRSVAGVTVVAVMAPPSECPHGRCLFCPGGVTRGTPQSYTGKEPAARRAGSFGYDAYLQARNRLDQLATCGHSVEKVEAIIMGGTFLAQPQEEKEGFARRLFDAFNGSDSGSMEEALTRNETAPHRCIGLTYETRPDLLTAPDVEGILSMGGTRVEMGVQTLRNEVLEAVCRGHTVEQTVSGTRVLKEHGMKVTYHMMPGLPGTVLKDDLDDLWRLSGDGWFRPDCLKIYPTLVVPGTELSAMFERGEYIPPETGDLVDMLAQAFSVIPPYVRIQRMQRDIPSDQLLAGVMSGNLRQMVEKKMVENGTPCRCIRCREAARHGKWVVPPGVDPSEAMEIPDRPLHGRIPVDMDDLRLDVCGYDASGGREWFVSHVDDDDHIFSYLRYRVNGVDGEKAGRAFIRELRVVGAPASLGVDPLGDIVGEGEEGCTPAIDIEPAPPTLADSQHRGLGTRLLEWAEDMTVDEGIGVLDVMSGVGVRGYYRSKGYSLDKWWMRKRL